MLGSGMAVLNTVGSSLFSVGAFGITTAANYALSGLVNWRIAALFLAGGVVGGGFGMRAAVHLVAKKGALTRFLPASSSWSRPTCSTAAFNNSVTSADRRRPTGRAPRAPALHTPERRHLVLSGTERSCRAIRVDTRRPRRREAGPEMIIAEGTSWNRSRGGHPLARAPFPGPCLVPSPAPCRGHRPSLAAHRAE